MRGESRFNLTDGYVRLTIRQITSKVNSPLKMSKLFQFQNSVFPAVLSSCCSMVHCITVEI